MTESAERSDIAGGFGLFLADTKKSPKATFEKVQALLGHTGRRVGLYFGNWDDDPRELYDIPECRAWCKAFIELGGLSLLDRPKDLPPAARAFPSQYLMVAIAGMPGAARLGPFEFSYDHKRIAQLEREYLS